MSSKIKRGKKKRAHSEKKRRKIMVRGTRIWAPLGEGFTAFYFFNIDL